MFLIKQVQRSQKNLVTTGEDEKTQRSSIKNVTNALFVGSTDELQKMLKGNIVEKNLKMQILL